MHANFHIGQDVQKARHDLTDAKRHLHELGSKGQMEVKEKSKLEEEYQKKMEKAHVKVKELMKKQQVGGRFLKGWMDRLKIVQ